MDPPGAGSENVASAEVELPDRTHASRTPPGRKGWSRARVRPLALLVSCASLAAAACSSGAASPGLETIRLGCDLPAAVNALLAAAPACGLHLMDARRDEATGTAFLVFLEEWQSPRPESALVTVRLEPVAGGVSSRFEAHPLAEYGMQAPDIRAGSEGFVCKPCSEARTEIAMVKYSRGQAMANGARTSRCLGSAIGSEVPSGD